MLQSLNELGYAVERRVINAAEYEMPQRRVFIFDVPFGRAFRSNLFVRNEQKEFPLQSLTQNAA